MGVVQILGINDFHPDHQKIYDEEVRKEMPDAMCFGSTGKTRCCGDGLIAAGQAGRQAGGQA